MAPLNAPEGKSGTLCRVVSGSGLAAEFGAAPAADQQISTESIAAVRAAPAIDLTWLGAVETALHQLQQHHVEDPMLAEAVAVAARLRAALAIPGAPEKSATALWLCLYCCISLPFLNHFSSAIGDELGHAMAHQIVKVLSGMAHHLEF